MCGTRVGGGCCSETAGVTSTTTRHHWRDATHMYGTVAACLQVSGTGGGVSVGTGGGGRGVPWIRGRHSCQSVMPWVLSQWSVQAVMLRHQHHKPQPPRARCSAHGHHCSCMHASKCNVWGPGIGGGCCTGGWCCKENAGVTSTTARSNHLHRTWMSLF
jgi:hypothetical protein